MMRVGTPHYNFDSTNAQEPFTYMARIIGTNEIAVGYVVVAKAAYCPKIYASQRVREFPLIKACVN